MFFDVCAIFIFFHPHDSANYSHHPTHPYTHTHTYTQSSNLIRNSVLFDWLKQRKKLLCLRQIVGFVLPTPALSVCGHKTFSSVNCWMQNFSKVCPTHLNTQIRRIFFSSFPQFFATISKVYFKSFGLDKDAFVFILAFDTLDLFVPNSRWRIKTHWGKCSRYFMIFHDESV